MVLLAIVIGAFLLCCAVMIAANIVGGIICKPTATAIAGFGACGVIVLAAIGLFFIHL